MMDGHENPAARGAAVRRLNRRRILLVDDDFSLRAGVAHLIDRQPDLAVAGEAAGMADAFRLLSGGGVDMVLTDLSLADGDGISFVTRLLNQRPSVPALILSVHDEVLCAEAALKAGARGYLMKDVGSTMLLEAIRRILAGEVYLSPVMTARLLAGVTAAKPNGSLPLACLSGREREVFRLMGAGKNTREIAAELQLRSYPVNERVA